MQIRRQINQHASQNINDRNIQKTTFRSHLINKQWARYWANYCANCHDSDYITIPKIWVGWFVVIGPEIGWGCVDGGNVPAEEEGEADDWQDDG